MLSYSVNILDALILSQHIVKDKQQQKNKQKSFEHDVEEICKKCQRNCTNFLHSKLKWKAEESSE